MAKAFVWSEWQWLQYQAKYRMLDWWLCNDNAELGGGTEASWWYCHRTIGTTWKMQTTIGLMEIWPGPQIVKLWKLRLQRPGIYEHLIIVWRHKALLIAIILWKSSGHIYRSRIPSYKTYFHIFYAGFVEAKNVNYNLVIYNYKESLNSPAQAHSTRLKIGEVLWRGRICSLLL